jgi:hypothetical protein
VPGVVTPAELLVEADQPQRLVLTLPRHVPAIVETFTPPRGGDGIEKTGKLVPGAVLDLDATPAGKVTVQRAPHCQALATPAECTLAPGTYTVDYSGPTAILHATRSVAIGSVDLKQHFEMGIVEAATGKTLQIGAGVRRAAFEAGPHKITVADDQGATHVVTVVVKAGATVIAQ